MAAATDLDILDRIRAIMTAYTGYTSANDISNGGAITVLPAFIVNPLETEWEPQSPGAKRFLVTQSFEIIGLVSVIADAVPYAQRMAAYRVAMPVVRPWVAWLHAHPLLALTGAGLVQSVGTITAGGFGPYTYPGDGTGKEYSAFRLQIPVTTYNS